MRKSSTRLLSLLLALVLLFGLLPAQIMPVAAAETDTVTFKSASISLAGDIGINFYLTMSDNLSADEGTYMEFTVADETQIVPITDAVATTSGGVTTYRFSCKVSARQMTETVVAQLHASDGTAVGESKEYSVEAYCKGAINYYSGNASYVKLINLMKAMLNYGAYSQTHFGYNTDKLANANVETDALPELTGEDVAAYAHGAEGSEAGISIASCSLLLESTTTIRFYFKVAEGYDISSYTFYVDGEEVLPVQSGSQYYVDKTNVSARNLDEMATVTVGGLTVWYCGLSYSRQVAVLYPTYYSEALVNVARALYAYNMAANAYFGCVVTFVDYDGTVLKTQIVDKGESAEAPAAPVREGYTFTGWDKSFDNVTADMTVTATYEPVSTETYTVTFTDYDGTVLSTCTVNEGGDAAVPADPAKSDTTFLGWSGNYVNVEQDETVRAVYSDEQNVFVVQSASGSIGDTVTVLVDVTGVVKICGFDFDLFYDEALELTSFDSDLDLDVLANADRYENGLKLNFSSASDKTKQRDIIELTFTIKDTAKKSLPITIEMNSIKEIVNDNPADTTYVIVNGIVALQ